MSVKLIFTILRIPSFFIKKPTLYGFGGYQNTQHIKEKIVENSEQIKLYRIQNCIIYIVYYIFLVAFSNLS